MQQDNDLKHTFKSAKVIELQDGSGRFKTGLNLFPYLKPIEEW